MYRSQSLLIVLQEKWKMYNETKVQEHKVLLHKEITNLLYHELPQAIDEDVEIKHSVEREVDFLVYDTMYRSAEV